MIDVVDISVGQHLETCPECDCRGIYVSTRGIARAGPIEMSGFDVHESQGAAYYHPSDD